MRQLLKFGQQWESRDWLTKPAYAPSPRRVMADLLEMLGLLVEDINEDRVPSGTTVIEAVSG
ncbi:MAG: hypothetical protein GY832_32100 [Chloroflexi bacterium]|nr:hypothetical protein [Chloroflexota bacterium]